MKNTSKKQFTPHILKTIKRTATLYTDEWGGYNKAGRLYTRYIIDHSKGQYVKGKASTNTIEGFWSIIKRGIIGIYHKTTRKHLHRYVNEFVFRYNTKEMSEYARFNWFLCNAEKYHITYKQLIT